MCFLADYTLVRDSGEVHVTESTPRRDTTANLNVKVISILLLLSFDRKLNIDGSAGSAELRVSAKRFVSDDGLLFNLA